MKANLFGMARARCGAAGADHEDERACPRGHASCDEAGQGMIRVR